MSLSPDSLADIIDPLIRNAARHLFARPGQADLGTQRVLSRVRSVALCPENRRNRLSICNACCMAAATRQHRTVRTPLRAAARQVDPTFRRRFFAISMMRCKPMRSDLFRISVPGRGFADLPESLRPDSASGRPMTVYDAGPAPLAPTTPLTGRYRQSWRRDSESPCGPSRMAACGAGWCLALFSSAVLMPIFAP